ncbi:hypothetical protein Nepgr_024161 [Nepenthes gracilis]|uniref:Uncharacterized protein n=1 Tax=Nepenthes gracilis TaxID=150966 RepID=A0AAD3XYI9_NEPGR|nr:hypothetical protein Nepgr_024161 [Nepenthes gracilis]
MQKFLLSTKKVRSTAKAGLSTAVIKAKLLPIMKRGRFRGVASTLNMPPAMVNNNISNRQPVVSASPSQPSISGY